MLLFARSGSARICLFFASCLGRATLVLLNLSIRKRYSRKDYSVNKSLYFFFVGLSQDVFFRTGGGYVTNMVYQASCFRLKTLSVCWEMIFTRKKEKICRKK